MSATLEQNTKHRFTVEEYLSREEIAECKAEYVDGDIIPMTGGSFKHSVVMSNLGAVICNAIRSTDLIASSSDLKCETGLGTFRYPDLSVINPPPQVAKNRTDVILNPLVDFEVLSTGTEAIERGKKFEEYRSIESLKAYVLVAQDHQSIECFTRQSNGTWNLVFANTGEITIPPLNCSIRVEDVYHKIDFTTIASEQT